MSDADAQRSAKALQDISHHLKELVKVQAALNENIVTFVRDAREFASEFSSISLVDPSQMSLEDIAKEIHNIQQRVRKNQPDMKGMVLGPDGKARTPFHGDPLRDVQQPDYILSFNPNDRVWVPHREEYGTVTVVGVEDEGKLFIEVELDNKLKVLCAPQVLTKVDRL